MVGWCRGRGRWACTAAERRCKDAKLVHDLATRDIPASVSTSSLCHTGANPLQTRHAPARMQTGGSQLGSSRKATQAITGLPRGPATLPSRQMKTTNGAWHDLPRACVSLCELMGAVRTTAAGIFENESARIQGFAQVSKDFRHMNHAGALTASVQRPAVAAFAKEDRGKR